VAGWGTHVGESVWLLRIQRQWAAANYAALPTGNAGWYATSHCKLLWFGFPCKCMAGGIHAIVQTCNLSLSCDMFFGFI